MARTDSEKKTPAIRLNDLRREWGLKSLDEATAQAQNKALGPLTKWLRRGEKSPEVVIRAIQVLLADPERPGVEKRPAIGMVAQQVSEIWANAGIDAQGMLGLQAMLLASWPYELTIGGFSFSPLFDSAWEVMRGRALQQSQIRAWLHQLPRPTGAEDRAPDAQFDAPPVAVDSEEVTFPDPDPNMQHLLSYKGQSWAFNSFSGQLIGVLQDHRAAITALDAKTNSIVEALSDTVTTLVNQLEPVLTTSLTQSRALSNFMWWGQSRYSQATRRPYRRIENTAERLWWMAWEASDLALGLAVEPAASFLVETIYQLDGRSDEQKRPLKDWLGELFATLRKLHQSESHANTLAMSGALRELAEEDSLGLPVTWVRLHAENPKGQDSDIEERAREELAIDLDAPVSRGDWAAWIFRESLLDRRLRDDEQEEK